MTYNVTKQDWNDFVTKTPNQVLLHILRCFNDLCDYPIFDSALDETNISLGIDLLKRKLAN